MSATAVSDWPTPTVSTSTTSKPAASQASIASRVRRATPPSVDPAGEGRMKAAPSRESASMRVLSPRIEPPERLELGSTASTATRWPASMTWRPNALDESRFPDPGGTADAEPYRPPGFGQQRVQKRIRLLPVVGARGLDQRDRARQRPAFACQHRRSKAGRVVLLHACRSPPPGAQAASAAPRTRPRISAAAAGIFVPGP